MQCTLPFRFFCIFLSFFAISVLHAHFVLYFVLPSFPRSFSEIIEARFVISFQLRPREVVLFLFPILRGFVLLCLLSQIIVLRIYT